MKENIKDYVVIDIDKYNNLQGENVYLREENKRLSNNMNLFENYFFKSILSDCEWELSKIEEFSLDDYYVRQLICKFLEYGSFDYQYMIDKIKEYTKSKDSDSNDNN